MSALIETAMDHARRIAANVPMAAQIAKELAIRSRDGTWPQGCVWNSLC